MVVSAWSWKVTPVSLRGLISRRQMDRQTQRGLFRFFICLSCHFLPRLSHHSDPLKGAGGLRRAALPSGRAVTSQLTSQCSRPPEFLTQNSVPNAPAIYIYIFLMRWKRDFLYRTHCCHRQCRSAIPSEGDELRDKQEQGCLI